MTLSRVARRRQMGAAAAGAAPALTGTSTASFGSGTSGAIAIPNTTKVGDLILLAVVSSTAASPTTPTGFANLVSKTQTGGGSNIGTNITVFSKTAVLSDIGANVTVSGVSGSWPWSLHARTYTTTGVDQTATAGVAGPSSGGSTLNPPVLTTSAKNEAIVTFFGGIAQTSGMTGVTIASGGSNVVTTKNASGFEFEFGEDWTLTAAGGTSTGGAVTDTRAFPTLVAISVSLLHS